MACFDAGVKLYKAVRLSKIADMLLVRLTQLNIPKLNAQDLRCSTCVRLERPQPDLQAAIIARAQACRFRHTHCLKDETAKMLGELLASLSSVMCLLAREMPRTNPSCKQLQKQNQSGHDRRHARWCCESESVNSAVPIGRRRSRGKIRFEQDCCCSCLRR